MTATWSELVAAAYRTDRAAVVAPGGRWSGRELLERAGAVARWVGAARLPAGTPVPALFGQTSADAVAATIGCAAVGHPLAPLSPRMTVPSSPRR